MSKMKAVLMFMFIVILPAFVWKIRSQSHVPATTVSTPKTTDTRVQFAATQSAGGALLTINFEADCQPEPKLVYRMETNKIIVSIENQGSTPGQCRQDFQSHLRVKDLSSGAYFVFWDGQMSSKPLKVEIP